MKSKYILFIILGVIVLLVLWAMSFYNGVIRLGQGVDGQWAQVEASYQRRFDLIPNLANTVKGIFKQENEVFGNIADARTRYAGAQTPSEQVAAANEMESAFARLLVIIENYPELRSAEAVQNLMSQLEGTENRISVERQRYNDTVRDYNVRVNTFPGNILAGIFGFEERTFFEAAEGAEEAPKVEF